MSLLTAIGIQRIEDMTREDLIAALRQMHLRYMEVVRTNMSGGQLALNPVHPTNEYREFWYGAHPTQSDDLDANA